LDINSYELKYILLINMIRDLIILIIITILYCIILFIIAPMVDHAFSPLHKDETNVEIFMEIIMQIITVSVIWFYLRYFINKIIHKYVHIKNISAIDTSIAIISGLILVGLQSHLKSKLEYITHEHPFRIMRIFND